ncbi:MAG TPA: hypothetical protein VKE40_21545 [Gemmataceae bacterium]|nr:hypothetical protein [Gemmataceae bacterium]
MATGQGVRERLYGDDWRGRRLVYTRGIVVLTAVSAILLIAFGGVADNLIPLFAVGAFLAFTLSQAGMVAHRWNVRGPRWRLSAAVNGVGAVVTAAALGVVLVAKFADGAWVTVGLLALLRVVPLPTAQPDGRRPQGAPLFQRAATDRSGQCSVVFDGSRPVPGRANSNVTGGMGSAELWQDEARVGCFGDSPRDLGINHVLAGR